MPVISQAMSNQLIFDTSLDTFEQDVLHASHNQPILVDFWAEWCPPCVVIAPLLEQVVNERAGEVALAKLEVDEGENMKLAGRYQVRGFPTIILFQNGEEKGRFSGAKPASHIEQFIDEYSEPG
jgi:thioredoxin 1